MAIMTLDDEVPRARQFEVDPDLARAIRTLSPDEPIVLRTEGRPMRFRKVLDQATRQPTDTVRPDESDAATGRQLQTHRGAMITVEPEAPRSVPYPLSLSATLIEWDSPEVAAAYDGL